LAGGEGGPGGRGAGGEGQRHVRLSRSSAADAGSERVHAAVRRRNAVMAKGTLIAAMNMGEVPADEFDDWYDTEHLPERQRVPGFLVCHRWIGADDPKISVATYDLESADVLKEPGYLAIGGENLSPWS